MLIVSCFLFFFFVPSKGTKVIFFYLYLLCTFVLSHSGTAVEYLITNESLQIKVVYQDCDFHQLLVLGPSHSKRKMIFAAKL